MHFDYEKQKQSIKEELVKILSDPVFLADDSFKGKLSGYSPNTTVQDILQYGTPLSDFTIANRIRYITYILYVSNVIAKFPSTITFVFDGNKLSHQIIDSRYFNYDTSKGYTEAIPTSAYYDYMNNYLKSAIEQKMLDREDVIEICRQVESEVQKKHEQR